MLRLPLSIDSKTVPIPSLLRHNGNLTQMYTKISVSKFCPTNYFNACVADTCNLHFFPLTYRCPNVLSLSPMMLSCTNLMKAILFAAFNSSFTIELPGFSTTISLSGKHLILFEQQDWYPCMGLLAPNAISEFSNILLS